MTNNLLNEDVYLTGLLSLPFVVLSETYKNKTITPQDGTFRMIKSILDDKRNIYAHFCDFENEMIIKNNLVDIIKLYNMYGLNITNGFTNTEFFYFRPGTTYRELRNNQILKENNEEVKKAIRAIRGESNKNQLQKDYMEYFEYHLKNWYKFLQLRQPIPNPELLTVEMQNIRDNKLYLMYFYSLPMVHWWEVQKQQTFDTNIKNILESLRNICCHANANYEEDFIKMCLRMVRYFYNHYKILTTTQENSKTDCFCLINDKSEVNSEKLDFHNLNIKTNVLCIPITVEISNNLSNLNLKDYLQKFVNRIKDICPTFIDQLALT